MGRRHSVCCRRWNVVLSTCKFFPGRFSIGSTRGPSLPTGKSLTAASRLVQPFSDFPRVFRPTVLAPVKNKITGTVLLCAPCPSPSGILDPTRSPIGLRVANRLLLTATCARNSAALFMCYGPGNCSSATAMAGTWRRLNFSTWGTKTKLPLKNPSSSLWILIAIPRAARDTFSIHFGLLTSPCANRFPSCALRSPLEMTATQLPA